MSTAVTCWTPTSAANWAVVVIDGATINGRTVNTTRIGAIVGSRSIRPQAAIVDDSAVRPTACRALPCCTRRLARASMAAMSTTTIARAMSSHDPIKRYTIAMSTSPPADSHRLPLR
jgi:hypothetical protein